jgi:hypothetical protein
LNLVISNNIHGKINMMLKLQSVFIL